MKKITKRKIAIILPSLKQLGPAIVMNNIINTIDKTEFEIILISLRKNTKEDLERYRGLKIIEIDMKKFPNMKTAKKIKKIVKENECDLIHVNSFWPTVLCAKLDVSKIVTVHNNPKIDFEYEYGKISGRLMANLYINALKNYDRVVSISKYVDEVLNIKNSTIVYNSTEDIKIQKNEKYEKIFGDSDINLYTVSVLNKLKNVTRIVEIVSLLVKEGINAKCIIVGDGCQRKKIENMIGKLNLTNNIILLGKQEKNVIKNISKLADVFIFTSLNEGFGLVLTEALRDKKYICCSDFETAHEILNSNTDSKICSTNSDFVQYIKELTESKRNGMHELISEKNREEYQRKYTNDIMCAQYTKIYKEVIKNNKKNIMYYIPFFGNGGIESLVLNFIKSNYIKYNFIIVVEHNVNNEMIEQLKLYNTRIIQIPNMKDTNIINYLKKLEEVFKNYKCDIFHSHDYTMRFFPIMYAFLYKIKKRILHIHTSSLEGKKMIRIKRIGIRINLLFANNIIVCSEEAKKFVKHKSAKMIINGVNSKKFKFIKEEREQVRKKLKIHESDIVIIQIGRLVDVKNHIFMLNVFKNLKDNYKFIILGDGVLRKEIEEFIVDNKYQDRVFLLGNVKDVSRYLSSADVFVLPSIFEGMPITLLEAQANGIKCLVSENITKQVDKFDLISYLNIDIESWVEALNELKLKNDREKYCKLLQDSEFDISEFKKKIERVYDE